ncbi:MAG: leucine-rich repeat domain-containing protein [Eubacteriales bacterium]|nr:leucine-rich repeat domain-containing protein [Eubacteriales bacterium]
MKRVFCCLTVAVLLFGILGCAAGVAPVRPDNTAQNTSAVTQTPNDDVIVFDDDALEALVREAIGKPEGDITVANAEQVTELELSQMGVDKNQPYIHNLSALQHFKNLTYLGLGYAVQNANDSLLPVDLSPLAGLTKLESLQMGGLVIDDLSALSGLHNLMSLTVFNGEQPLDLMPLAGLTNLQALTLRNNQIVDVSALGGLDKLIYLDLEGNQISDVTPLAGLTGLNRLFLSGNPISDYSALAAVRADLEEWDFEVQP